MEFLSGYAAARAPTYSYQVEPSQPSTRPSRSNSTSGTLSKKKRPRGHVRTSSADTSTTSAAASTSSSSSRPENPSTPHNHSHSHNHNLNQDQNQNQNQNQNQDQNQNNKPAWLQHTAFEGNALEAHAQAFAFAYAAPAPVIASSSTSRSTSSVLHRISRSDHQRERMPASPSRYTHRNKQLPATPRLDTNDAATSSKFLTAAAATFGGTESASARTPTSAYATSPSSALAAAASSHDRRMLQQNATMLPDPGASSKGPGYAGTRAESISSISGATTVSSRTMLSGEQSSGGDTRSFVVRNGRTYIADPTLSYPLPVDLEELHRQTLRTLLMIQLFGGPICSPSYASNPPSRVLEIGCGSAAWSMMCYKHYQSLGLHTNMSFTGIDIAPLAPPSNWNGPGNRESAASSAGAGTPADGGRAEGDMKWRFVQHDLRRVPLPFRDEEFDFIMVKDMSLATPTTMEQPLIDEYLRILAPGGTIELWESDHTIRMLRPHVPEPVAPSGSVADGDVEETSEEDDEQDEVAKLGAYQMTANTPLSSPLNHFLLEYNGWLARALEARSLSTVPCTVIGPMLIQEAEILTGQGSRRLAIPLSEVRWEREGVGGVVTKDGKSYIQTKGRVAAGKEGGTGKALEPAAAALRRTALLTVVQMIQSMEHILREVSGKSQDEWDAWLGKMMNDLVRENGTNWGECLEIGTWWARKRAPSAT